ncbi:MAG: glycosyltransferase [Pyrinomonadaceae bacterium]
MKKRVLFYCQPVLGIGHFIRSREIILRLDDFEVCFLNGGEIVAGFELPPAIEVVNLPALKTNAEFQRLFVADGPQNLDKVKEIRKQLLLYTYSRLHPDLLILELFPFGRRQFDFELIPLLERVRASSGSQTKIVCSLRDILVSKSNQAQYEQEVCDLMNEYFDLLLIHADPKLQLLDETFPRVQDIKCEIQYTGYVVQRPELIADEQPEHFSYHRVEEEPFVLVSIGGGRVGHELLECAIAAAALVGKSLPHRMHVITGPYMPQEQFIRFQKQAAGTAGVTIERFSTRFTSYLKTADLSISMAGYNTCMDILVAGVKSLVYPFTGNNNQEQTVRARKLERMGVVKMIREAELTPESLAEEMMRCLKSPTEVTSPQLVPLDIRGAEKTALLLTELAGRNFTGKESRMIKHHLLAELNSGLEQSQDENKALHFFFRDDDVDEAELSLQRLLHLFLSRGVPINLGVIPGLPTRQAVRTLAKQCSSAPDSIALNQHGWKHINHEKSGKKCEFGASRTFSEQLEDIANGQARMSEAFGDDFYPAFIPPWNRCTAETYRVLDQLGFPVLSKNQSGIPSSGYKFRECSITLDLYRWRGGATLKPPEEIIRDLILQIGQMNTVGIMLHHKVMNDEAFLFLDLLIETLSRYSIVRFHTFQSMLRMI